MPEDAAANYQGFDFCSADGGALNCVFNTIDANSTRTAQLPIEGATQQLSATMVQASDPSDQNNTTVVRTSGSGAFGLTALFMLILLNTFRAGRKHY